MKKNLYVARSANENTDSYKAFYSKEEARAEAEYLYSHLTASEREKNTVSVETYTITTDDDTITAEDLYDAALLEWSDEIQNPAEYEEIGD